MELGKNDSILGLLPLFTDFWAPNSFLRLLPLLAHASLPSLLVTKFWNLYHMFHGPIGPFIFFLQWKIPYFLTTLNVYKHLAIVMFGFAVIGRLRHGYETRWYNYMNSRLMEGVQSQKIAPLLLRLGRWYTKERNWPQTCAELGGWTEFRQCGTLRSDSGNVWPQHFRQPMTTRVQDKTTLKKLSIIRKRIRA